MPDPLVLLPGMMCDARLFGPQIAALSADTTVISAPVTQGDRIEEIASRLLDHFPRRFALAGHGLGGMVAMEILRRAPERITRLALIATSPLPETPQVAALRDPRIVKVRTGGLAHAMREELPLSALAPGSRHGDVPDLALAMAEALGPEVFVRQTRALQRRRDQQATLMKCGLPTLVLCGAHDTLYPVKRQSVMAELMPAAELLVLEGAGHLPSLESPSETTAGLRRWLAGEVRRRPIAAVGGEGP